MVTIGGKMKKAVLEIYAAHLQLKNGCQA